MAFHIKNLRTNELWPDEHGEPMVFETGEDAEQAEENLSYVVSNWRYYTTGAHERRDDEVNRYLSKQNINRADKWQVRKAAVASPEKWREREQAHFASKHYTPVPWADHPEWGKYEIKDHFLHVSRVASHVLCYTPSEEHGMEDRHVRISAQKYFLKHLDHVPEKVRTEWINLWFKLHTNAIIHYATTPQEIREVYINGPTSCMCSKPSKWFGSDDMPHPTEAYGAGDLAVAYIKNKSDTITARCVVWPEKKLRSSRFYGDESSLLKMLLECEDYKSGQMNGARILPIPYTKSENAFILPYIDGHRVMLVKDQLILQEDGKTANSTTGYMKVSTYYTSDKSGISYSPYLRGTSKVRVHLNPKEPPQTWAEKEVDTEKEGLFICDKLGEAFSSKHFSIFKVVDDMRGLAEVCKEKTHQLYTSMCQYHNLPTNSVFDVLVGFTRFGEPIMEKWSRHALQKGGFSTHINYGNGPYRHIARWLASKLWKSDLIPFFEEHLYSSDKIEPYKLVGEINKKSAEYMLRYINEKDEVVYHPSIQKQLKDGCMYAHIDINKLAEEKKEKVIRHVKDRTADAGVAAPHAAPRINFQINHYFRPVVANRGQHNAWVGGDFHPVRVGGGGGGGAVEAAQALPNLYDFEVVIVNPMRGDPPEPDGEVPQ